MYILTTKATHTDPEDRELIESEGEGAQAMAQVMYDEQFIVASVHVIDDYTDQPIELQLHNYFSTDIVDLPWGKREVTLDEILGCAE